MKILIVSATKNEIEPLLKQLNIVSNNGSSFKTTIYKNHSLDIIISGVGMTSTAYYTTKALSQKFDLILNVGICGSFNKNIELGSVVNIYQDTFSELGAEDDNSFLTLENLNLKGVQTVQNQSVFSNKTIDSLPKVNGITVNTSHGNESSIEKVFQLFHPYVESMEGAAFMFVCEKEKATYFQIRAVSNYVEKRNRDSWNIPLSIENLNKKIFEILSE